MKFLLQSIVIYVIIYICALSRVRSDIWVESTSVLIILYSSYCLFKRGQPPFSLAKMFNLFSIFFFGFAPWVQFIQNITFWRLGSIEASQYLTTNIVILILIIIFNVVYSFSHRSIAMPKYYDNIKNNNLTISKFSLYLLVIISLISMLYVFRFNNFNITDMIFRGVEGESKIRGGQIQQLIISNFIRPMPMIIFLFYTMCKNSRFIIKFLLCCCAIFTVMPTATARLFAAAMYIPLILILFPTIRKNENFTFVFIAGLLVLFPFLNNFRWFSADKEISIGLNFDMFLEGHFDAFQNFSTVLVDGVITYGYQLLGPLFFFIPRSMWEGKPVGSGHLIAQSNNYTLDNISMPFFAEGYINFGIIGSALYVVILAMVCKRLDLRYWTVKNSKNHMFNIQYYLLIGLSFFILRGDMLSGTAYTTGILMSTYAVSKLITFNKVN